MYLWYSIKGIERFKRRIMTPKLLYLYNEIEIVRMKAKMMEVGNSDRLHRGASIKYEEKHFEDLIRRLLVEMSLWLCMI
jgi:hypothetical protein